MHKKKIIISIIGFYIFWLGLMPLIVSNTIVVLCKNISHNSSFGIKIKNPKTYFSILPVAYFKADEITVNAKNSLLTLNVKDFKTSVRLLPLLSGRFHINKIESGNVDLSTNLTKKVEINKAYIDKLLSTRLQVDDVRIKQFVALLYQKEIATPIEYKGQGFIFERKNRYIRLKNNSSLNIAGKVTQVTSNLYLPKNNDLNKTVFDVNLSNIELSRLGMYFNQYLPEDLKEIKGNISIYANKNELITELNGCSIIMQDLAKSIILPDKMSIKSKFNINKHSINLEDVNIESDNIHVAISGRIMDYFGKTMPTVDLSVRLNKSKVEDIVSMLPPFKVEEIDVYKLKKYKFYANTLANLKIKGRLPDPEINGDIYIDDGILIKPIPNTSRGATIKLNFAGRSVNFDVVVPAGDLEKVYVEGSQELYNIKYADFTVKSTKGVNLSVAQGVVEPLHEILNFVIGPIPIMDINGSGNIDIIVKGNRKNPRVWGNMNFINSKVKFKEMPNLLVTDTNAILHFDDQNAHFLAKDGKLNGTDITIDGTCDLSGKFDFHTKSLNQPINTLYEALKTSLMFPEIKNLIPDLDTINGLIDFDLKIFGMVKDFNDIKFNKNVFANGELTLKNDTFSVDNISVENTNGKVSFGSNFAKADIKAFIGNLPLSLKGNLKDGLVDLDLEIPRLNPNFLLSNLETRKKQFLPYISVKGRYKGLCNNFSTLEELVKNIEYEKLSVKAKILESNPKSSLKFNSGEIVVANNQVELKNIKGYLDNVQNLFQVDLKVNDAFLKTREVSGIFKLKTPDLTLFNEILLSNLFPEEINKYVKDFKFKAGALDLNGRIFSNKIYAQTDLGGVSFVYLPLSLPVEIINGTLSARNSNLFLNKINLLADGMPILVDGDVKDIFNKQNFDLYFNSKPKQEFIDKYVNNNQIYPIKIKGDIVYSVKLKGNANDYDLKAQVDMSKDSSIYHFGATIGDIENSISASLDSRVLNKNHFKIKEFSYNKLIDSLSGKQTRLNMLKAWGGVEVLEDDLAFDNLYIKTSHPTDARIFNIIFRKPNIKQGQFTSDLKFNGKLSDARVLGDFHIFETNIPFFDTSLKNIELVFKDKSLFVDAKGDVLGNDISFNGILKNRLKPPYRIEQANFYTKDLDLNEIVNKVKVAQVDNLSPYETFNNIDLSLFTADNFNLKADNIKLRNIHATDFEALVSLNEKHIFDVKNFRFNIAQGVLNGKFNYNLKTDDMGINLKAKSISANDLTWALFDLKNQVYGDMTGDVNLSCNGLDFQHCMQTLSGESVFNIKDGRMPKLGSLEYLLKAGNLVKGGITGVSINNIIDIITPLKTGDFSDIYGQIRIKDGIARNIEISSKGKDLSLFIDGTYNFSTSNAEMVVLGLLSKKISTFLGPIGNISINTLFNIIPGIDLSRDSVLLDKINKIPAIELSEKDFRKFIAEIKGNINGEDYVTSFKWIN